MSSVASTGSTQSAAAAASALGAAPAQQIQNEFLTLLVTQLKNQDPLNPLDSTQMTSQLAQISTVQGVQDLNTSIQSLLAQMNALQSLDATNLIGHNALVAGNSLTLGTNGADAGYELPSAVDGGTISIKDATGTVIQTIALPSTSQGVATFHWDGSTSSGSSAPAGTYSFSIAATAGGSAVTATTLSEGKIQGIDSSSTGASVLNMGPLGQHPVSDIVQLM